jgi:hypothetical protein
MPKRREHLKYEPLYKPKPVGEEPPKPPGLWATVLRLMTCGLIRGRRTSQG